MVNLFLNLVISFLSGVFAPLGAVCVLPLYPGFLAFLSNKLKNDSKHNLLILGSLVASGILSSMFLLGLIFTNILQKSLTGVIGIISPIAFGLLAIVSILMMLNVSVGNFFPKIQSPMTKNAYLGSFIFGFFFGGIVLPCNPASLIVLFAISSSTLGYLTNMLYFVVFGFGMALPLFILAAFASTQVILKWLTRHNRNINIVAGAIMFIISLYYLLFVFEVI